MTWILWTLVVIFEVGCYYRDDYKRLGWGLGPGLEGMPFIQRALTLWLTFGLVFSFVGPWLFNSLKEARGETRTVIGWLLISTLVWGVMAATASGINRWHLVSFALLILSGLCVVKAGG